MPNRTARKPKGMSLHIGLNKVDPKHYGGWEGRLSACEFDARDLQKIASGRGFKPRLLRTRQATSAAVISSLTDAAETLKSGDMLIVSYSGHGGQVPDKNGEEGDEKDETWCLFDRMLVDDELYSLWGRFEEGVRIFVLSDSCHSGSVLKARRRALIRANPQTAGPLAGRAPKFIPRSDQEKTYKSHQAMYDRIQRSLPNGDRAAVGATVLLISGCQDAQESLDGDRNGLFTEMLKKVWNGGKFRGGYERFHKSIGELMPDEQSPNYMAIGMPNPHFERQRPFTI